MLVSLGCGSSVPSGDSCEQLTGDYGAAVAAALACSPGTANQCQVFVASLPTSCPSAACDSQKAVNDNTSVEAVREKWLVACGIAPFSCPAFDVACPNVHPAGVCVASGAPGAKLGTCVPYAPTDAGN
jgi:hypothetical protein